MATASVIFDIIGRDRASDKFDKVAKSADGTTSKMERLGKIGKLAGAAVATGFAVAAAVVVKGGLDAIGKASDLNETMSKSQAIFGKHAAAMSKWADGAARSVGLSKQAALESSASFGDMFNQIGFGEKQAARMSKRVVQMSADLGSFNNLETSDVADRMSAAFRGEYDSLQAVIPNINAARVESEALAKTGKKTAAELTAQEKAAAVLAIVHKDGARAMGDFERTSGGLANQQKILKAQLENVQAAIGQKLLPVAVDLATWFNDKGLPAVKRLGDYLGQKLPPIFDKVKAVVGRVMGALRGDVGGKMGEIKGIFRDAVSIIRSLWKAFGGHIMQYARAAFKNVKMIISGAFDVIRGIFKTVSSLLKGDWKGAWNGIKLILRGAVKILAGIVRQLFNLMRLTFKAGLTAIKAVFSALWDGIKTVAKNGATWLVDQVKAIPGNLKAIGSKFLEAGEKLVGKLWEGVKNTAGNAGGFVADLLSKIRNGVNDTLNLPLKVSLPKLLGGGTVTVIPAFARGTNFAPGGLALVGEEGPELVNLPRGSKVTPNGPTMARLGAGGGGGDVHIHVHGFVGSEEKLAKEIERVMIAGQRGKSRPYQFRAASA